METIERRFLHVFQRPVPHPGDILTDLADQRRHGNGCAPAFTCFEEKAAGRLRIKAGREVGCCNLDCFPGYWLTSRYFTSCY